MKDKQDTELDREADMDEIGKLIRYAGAREDAGEERFARAHARVQDHWQHVVAARRKRQVRTRTWQFAVAASVVVAVSAALFAWRGAQLPQDGELVVVNRVVGDVTVDGTPLLAGEALEPGTTIHTDDGSRIALDLPDGQSMRIDSESSLVVAGPSRYRLDAGAVYVDSGSDPASRPVFIETRFGVATDVGTQFQVRVNDATLHIGVREGLVELATSDADVFPVSDGSFLEYTGDGVPLMHVVGPGDERWGWVENIAPTFDIEGTTLESYLEWYARQRGLELRWEDETSRSKARGIRLSGSIGDLSLGEGLVHVQQIAPFVHRVTGNALIVRVE